MMNPFQKANALWMAFVVCGVVCHLAIKVNTYGQNELLVKRMSTGPSRMTMLGPLSDSGVNTGEEWKQDETVPLGSSNPAAVIFQAGTDKPANDTSVASERPVEDKGEAYGSKLQKAGVNTGELNSHWNREFSSTDSLEPSYNIGSSPGREKESFSGLVNDVLTGKDGVTVKKSMQKFDAALSQFVAAEKSSLASLAKHPLELSSESRQGNTAVQSLHFTQKPTAPHPSLVSKSIPSNAKVDAHDFFRKNLSPLLHHANHGKVAVVQQLTTSPDKNIHEEGGNQIVSQKHAKQSSFNTVLRDTDPAVEAAGQDLFAKIRKVDEEAKDVGSKAGDALQEARQVEAQAAKAASIAARVGGARLMVQRAKQLEKAEEGRFRRALAQSKETLQLAGTSAGAAQIAAAAAVADARAMRAGRQSLRRRRPVAAREWHSATDGPNPARFTAQALATAGLRPPPVHAPAASAKRGWCDPLGLLCL